MTIAYWTRTFWVLALALSAAPQQDARRFPTDVVRTYYTVQVHAVPRENRQALRETDRLLREEERLVYYSRRRVGQRCYVRLRTGLFESVSDARACAEQLRIEKGFDPFVTEARVHVDPDGNGTQVVTTPSGIWHRSGGPWNELYRFEPNDVTRPAAARLSPAATHVAFCHNGKIISIDLDTGIAKTLKKGTRPDELLNCDPRWSPDGHYLAYLDAVAWELPTRLWVMRADGTDARCLVCDDSRQTKVKSFLWHPCENKLFYVAGPTHGTVSVGGSLYCTDLQGNHEMIVPADPVTRTEVFSEFRVVDDRLYYKTACFDESHRVREYLLKTLEIPSKKILPD